MGIHLRPTAEPAFRALLPGDPGRALRLAQALLDGPRMFNHHRGLWGYTGMAADGAPLLVQATGMGGPSAAIVLEELADVGVEVAVRVGTCGALATDLALGELVVATQALGEDGASRAFAGGPLRAGDPALVQGLVAASGAGARAGLIVSTDLFYDPRPERGDVWAGQGALAVEMESAALLAVAHRRGLRAATLLAVTDLLGSDGRERIDEEALTTAEERLGTVAWQAVHGAG